MKIFTYLLLLALLSNVDVTGASTDFDLIQNEDHIPFYAELKRDIVVDSVPLKRGDRVVVIRPESATSVRVDASRLGVITVPVDATNIAEEIVRLRGAKDENLKRIPRMAFFLTNRIISGESGWLNPLSTNRVHETKRWIFLYGDATDPDTASAITAASKYYNDLSDEIREETVFVYMDVPGNKAAIRSIAETLKPSIQCMPGYLSRGYVGALDHLDETERLPQLIEVAPSGRIMERILGLGDIRAWLSSK